MSFLDVENPRTSSARLSEVASLAKASAKKIPKTKIVPYDAAEQLRTPEEMAAWLDAWRNLAPDVATDDTSSSGSASFLNNQKQAKLMKLASMLPVGLACAVLISACASTREGDPALKANKTPPDIVGADKDSHGCIGSAGYQWCEREGKCVRPWELARAQGFEATPESFGKYCGSGK